VVRGSFDAGYAWAVVSRFRFLQYAGDVAYAAFFDDESALPRRPVHIPGQDEQQVFLWSRSKMQFRTTLEGKQGNGLVVNIPSYNQVSIHAHLRRDKATRTW